METLGVKKTLNNRTISTGFRIPMSVFEKLEEARKSSYESRSHYVSRLLSAALDKGKTETA